MPTSIDLHIHLLVVINEYETSNILGANTLRGGQLRQFIDMCIKNTLAKCVAFWVSFLMFGFYILIFTKLMLSNII